jgi:hypothetical protein
VRLYDDRLECLLGTTLVVTLPRGRPAHSKTNRTVHVVDYHHVIHALRRKPGALLNLVYRDQLFPRDAYRQAWDALSAAHPARIACRVMVGLLELAHDRACEADLAVELERLLATGALPELDALGQQFATTVAAIPDVTVTLPPVSSYDALLTAVTCMATSTGASA